MGPRSNGFEHSLGCSTQCCVLFEWKDPACVLDEVVSTRPLNYHSSLSVLMKEETTLCILRTVLKIEVARIKTNHVTTILSSTMLICHLVRNATTDS